MGKYTLGSVYTKEAKSFYNVYGKESYLTHAEEIETLKIYQDLLKVAHLCAGILIPTSFGLGKRRPNEQVYFRDQIIYHVKRYSAEIDDLLSDAIKNANQLVPTAIALEKRLITIRGEGKIAKEEKWAINLVKNIDGALVAQRKLNAKLLSLANQTPLNIEEIDRTAALLGKHIVTIAQYVRSLKEMEVLTEKQEKEFASRGKV